MNPGNRHTYKTLQIIALSVVSWGRNIFSLHGGPSKKLRSIDFKVVRRLLGGFQSWKIYG